MPNTGYPVEDLRRVVEAVEVAWDEGYRPRRAPSVYQVAGERLGLGAETVSRMVMAAHEHPQVEWPAHVVGLRGKQRCRRVQDEIERAADTEPPPAKTRKQVADVKFLKGRVKALEKSLERAERVAEELAGIRQVDARPPEWIATASSAQPHRAAMGLFISDTHDGEEVREGEIEGLGAYNPDVFERRFRRYVDATCEMGPRWMSDCKVEGAYLALGGDLTSGDIHEELSRTNSLTALEQVTHCRDVMIPGIEAWAETFGQVHVVSVPGNHSRITKKPPFKGYSRLSYDTLIADMLRQHFKDDPRITFQISGGIDATTPVFGWNVMLTHGDRIGTGGGQGFAGPFLPIVRGQKKLEIQQFRARRAFDLLLTAHYHVSGQPGPHLANGSMVGYSEFAHGIRAAVEPPQQWAFVLHQRWLLRERAEIKLEDPVAPSKPRVRVPASLVA